MIIVPQHVTNERRIHIEAPPKRVYAMVSDVTRMGEWSPECTGCAWLDGATGPAVGARFKGTNKRKGRWSTISTITAAVPGVEFAFRVGNGETRWRYRFESSGDGVDVTESFEIVETPGFMGRVLTKIGTGVSWKNREADMTIGMQQTLERVKQAAERG